jgi:hypothetical protein
MNLSFTEKLMYFAKKNILTQGSAITMYKNNEIIFIVEESPEGGYEAHSLGHSIFTEAVTFEELKAMVQDAVSCHFKDDERPHVIRLHSVKEELIAV